MHVKKKCNFTLEYNEHIREIFALPGKAINGSFLNVKLILPFCIFDVSTNST